MPETRHRTILEVGLDDRGLRQLGPSLERALNPRVAENFEKVMERSSAALSKLVEQQTKLGKLLDEQDKKRKRRDDDERRSRRDDIARGSARGSFMGTLGAQMLMRTNQLVGQALPVQEGWLGQMMSGIPVVGPFFNSVVGAAQSYYQSHVAQQTARARGFGATGLGNRGMGAMRGAGTQFGIGPTELPGMLAQIAQTTGLRGGGLSAAAPRSMALQQLLGIDAGGVVNAAMTSGGDQERALQAMTDAVTDGMEAGVRESRLTEVLQQVAGVVTQMRTQGVSIDIGSVTGLMRSLSGLGPSFHGEAGAAAARSITQGMSGVSDRQGVISALAIRNRMQQTGEDYETAARNIESNPTQAFQSVMGTLSRFRGTRGFETMLRTSFGGAGVSFSRAQAHDLAAGNLGGAAAPGADLDARLAQARTQSEGVFGTPETEANYQYQRAGIGGNPRVAGLVRTLRSLEMGVVQQTLPAMATVAQAIVNFAAGAVAAIRSGGIPGLIRYVSEASIAGVAGLLPSGRPTMGQVQDAQRALDESTEALGEGVASGLRRAGVSPEVADILGASVQGGASAVADPTGTAERIWDMAATGGEHARTAEGVEGTSLGVPLGTSELHRRMSDGSLQKAGGRGGVEKMRVEITIVDRTQGGVDVAR